MDSTPAASTASTPFTADERKILAQQVENIGFGVCPHCRIAFEPQNLPDRLRCECQGCGRWYELATPVMTLSSSRR